MHFTCLSELAYNDKQFLKSTINENNSSVIFKFAKSMNEMITNQYDEFPAPIIQPKDWQELLKGLIVASHFNGDEKLILLQILENGYQFKSKEFKSLEHFLCKFIEDVVYVTSSNSKQRSSFSLVIQKLFRYKLNILTIFSSNLIQNYEKWPKKTKQFLHLIEYNNLWLFMETSNQLSTTILQTNFKKRLLINKQFFEFMILIKNKKKVLDFAYSILKAVKLIPDQMNDALDEVYGILNRALSFKREFVINFHEVDCSKFNKNQRLDLAKQVYNLKRQAGDLFKFLNSFTNLEAVAEIINEFSINLQYIDYKNTYPKLNNAIIEHYNGKKDCPKFLLIKKL